MWVFTKYGFYSAVVDKRDKTKLAIRTRDRKHLDNLLDRFPALQSVAVEEEAGTDDQFRIVLEPKDWVLALSEMGAEITYTNFKSMSHRRQALLGTYYVYALSEIWQKLWDAWYKSMSITERKSHGLR